jgi:hypothetical protein
MTYAFVDPVERVPTSMKWFIGPMRAQMRKVAFHEPQVDQPPITRIVADNESRPIRAHPSHPRFKGRLPR